jgi:transposase
MTSGPPEPRDPGGRPSRLTPEVSARIVEVVRAGNYLTVAAQFAGVGISTLQGWLARGRKAAAALDAGEEIPPEERRYLEFLAAVSQAEVHAEVLAATAWRSMVTQDWRAARDYLRYRVPDRWRAVTTVNLRPEEAEQRVQHAVNEALTSLGIDTPEPGGITPDPGRDDTAALLAELTEEEPNP